MHIIPTTTKTFTRKDGAEVTVSEWIIGNYTLARISDVEYVDWKVTADGRGLPDISDTAGFGEAPHFGVNWSAHGAVNADEAIDYAARIMVAATIAGQFNAIIAAN